MGELGELRRNEKITIFEELGRNGRVANRSEVASFIGKKPKPEPKKEC